MVYLYFLYSAVLSGRNCIDFLPLNQMPDKVNRIERHRYSTAAVNEKYRKSFDSADFQYFMCFRIVVWNTAHSCPFEKHADQSEAVTAADHAVHS